MRIVILISVFERGGAERQAFLLARELRQRHDVDAEVWALLFPGEYARDFEAAGIPTEVIGFRWPRSKAHFLWQLPRVIRHLRRKRIDVLMPFTTWPNVVAGLTYRLAGIRHCIWGERHAGGERVQGFEHLAATQYKRFIANSTAGAEFLADEMRIERNRIFYVPNGVELPQPDPGMHWRKQLDLAPGQLLTVKVANLTAFKDHATLLRAWRIVQDNWTSGAPPVLALAGYHGDRSKNLQALVNQSGLDSTVRFLGSVKDVPTLLDACDLAVFSSRREGMPNGVLECMAAGKAVIATDLPGVRDALGPAASTWTVPAAQVDPMAARLLDVLQDRGKRVAQGKANLDRIRSEFSVERMASAQLSLIRAEAGGIGVGLQVGQKGRDES